MRIFGVFRCVSMIGLSIAAVGSAQQKPQPKSATRPGIVSGRVFAITEGGDLKPARMASVYALYMFRSVKAVNTDQKENDSAGVTWQASYAKASGEMTKVLGETNATMEQLGKERDDLIARENAPGLTIEQRQNLLDADEALSAKQHEAAAGWSASIICQKELMAYQKSLVDTLQWASDEHKEWQIATADADEDGNFKIALTHPGLYILLARGHAGFNEAFWVSDNFTVNLGAGTSVNLSEPQKACLVDVQ